MNVLKRSYEGDRVGVWAEPDQATDVCEGCAGYVRRVTHDEIADAIG